MYKLYVLWFTMSCLLLACTEKTEPDSLTEQAGIFKLATGPYFQNKALDVHYFIPPGDVSKMQTVIIMHGADRNALDYIKPWIQVASNKKLILLAPSFPDADYNTQQYNEGNAVSNEMVLNEAEKTTFSLIDRLIESFANEFKLPSKKYQLYGHSAGSQFVHRFAMIYSSPYVDKIYAANAGWYTFPNLTIAYPYGLGGVKNLFTGIQSKAFAKPVNILIGENDIIRDASLRVTPEAEAQGKNRAERGKMFYNTSQSLASSLSLPYNWKFYTVPNVGHDHVQMSKYVADLVQE